MFMGRGVAPRVNVRTIIPIAERGIMKNPMEVLRAKEQEIIRIRKEVEALQIVARLLSEDNAPSGGQKQDLRQLIEMP
jgi:hypothetical protein